MKWIKRVREHYAARARHNDEDPDCVYWWGDRRGMDFNARCTECRPISPPSYHDLHITTEQMYRTSIFDLPYGYEVTCTRVTGWVLWFNEEFVAGEYDKRGLRLDVAGHVIIDSIGREIDDE